MAATGWALGGAVAGALAVYLLAPSSGQADDDAPAAAQAMEQADGALHLDADAMKEAGIALAPLAPASEQTGASGYARALDLSPLAGIAADIATAQAAIAASQGEAKRLEALAAADDSASRRDVEAARAQASADRAKLTLACQRVALEYGAGLGRLGCGAVPGLVREAAAGRLAVIRVDVPGTDLRAGMPVEIGSGGAAARVSLLGPAAQGDAQLQSAGALALVRGKAAVVMPIGRVLSASLAGGPRRDGVTVPREAIVRSDGGLFVYVAAGNDGFVRVPLEGGQPGDKGWFVPTGALKPGIRVVVSGAGTLLGLESSAPEVDD